MSRFRRVAAAAVAAVLLAGAGSGPGAADAPFFFIQMSDPQFGMYAADSGFAQETANFGFAIEAANRLRPAFVIVTGDLVNRAGDAAQIAEYRRIAAQLDPAIPLYSVPGNHDVGNTPTPGSLAAYAAALGPDHYSFRAGTLAGIVLNSSLIDSSAGAPVQFVEQERWLRTELARQREAGVRHIVVFQHHSWFLAAAAEPDGYFTIPEAHRARYLALFRNAGVRYLFSGHYHRNAVARDGGLEAVTTGAVGKPLGPEGSGFRVVIVTDTALVHRWYGFGDLPRRVALPD